MKAMIAILTACALVSCASTGYRSEAPEQGARIIASKIELVGAVETDSYWYDLGVFLSREFFADGEGDYLLFAIGRKSNEMKINNYNLRLSSSLSTDQARKLQAAIDTYLKMDPKLSTTTELFNFELYSGTVDRTLGSTSADVLGNTGHPFTKITLEIFFSVTNAGKSFEIIVPAYDNYRLTDEQASKLQNIIGVALEKTASPSASKKESGT